MEYFHYSGVLGYLLTINKFIYSSFETLHHFNELGSTKKGFKDL